MPQFNRYGINVIATHMRRNGATSQLQRPHFNDDRETGFIGHQSSTKKATPAWSGFRKSNLTLLILVFNVYIIIYTNSSKSVSLIDDYRV